jgi:hypothetical protein
MIGAYERLKVSERAKVQRELTNTEGELARLVERFALLTNNAAIEVTNRKIAEVGSEVETLRESLPQPGPLHVLREEMESQAKQLADAKRRLTEQGARRKGEDLRRVVSKIDSHFRHYRLGGLNKSALESVTIHPLSGDATRVASETPPAPR